MGGVLHLVCGKIAAGKSTLCARLAAETGGLLIAEDHWTSHLWGAEMREVADYVRCSARLRAAIGPHIVELLKRDLVIILDFAANTVERRAWMRGLAEAASAQARLHLLDVPDEVCRARMHARSAAGEHPFAPTDAHFDLITSYFAAPTEDEGLEVVVHPVDQAR